MKDEFILQLKRQLDHNNIFCRAFLQKMVREKSGDINRKADKEQRLRNINVEETEKEREREQKKLKNKKTDKECDNAHLGFDKTN